MARLAGGAALGCVVAALGCGSIAEAPLGQQAEPVRPDTPGNALQFSFEPGDVVETHASPGGRFLVHFTRAGPNAVPSADTDTSGVPDFVEQVATTYDEVGAFYAGELGFREPLGDGAVADNGGSDQFDVYLVDFAGIGDGNYRNDTCLPDNGQRCAGYMVQENDYAGYGYPSTTVANRILASHEYFHAVQAAYDIDQGSIFSEGSAVWATEQFDPSLRDFEYFISGYLDNPDRSLDVPMAGPVDPFSYGSALVFQFLGERFGSAVVRELWEAVENGYGGVADPQWIEQLDGVLASHGSSFGEAFVELATWNLFTDVHADPARAYAGGASYPLVARDLVSAPYSANPLRVFHASAQYYQVDVDGRGELGAELVGDTADLELLFAVRRGRVYDPIERAAGEDGAKLVSTAGADALVVAVINPLPAGESKKPGLCIGSAAELDACAAELGGDDAGTPTSTPPPSGGESSGCSCRTETRGGLGGFGWLAAAALMGLRRRSFRVRRGKPAK